MPDAVRSYTFASDPSEPLSTYEGFELWGSWYADPPRDDEHSLYRVAAKRAEPATRFEVIARGRRKRLKHLSSLDQQELLQEEALEEVHRRIDGRQFKDGACYVKDLEENYA